MSRHNLGEKNMNIQKELELELANDHHYQLLLGEIKDLHKRQAILETRIASYDKLRLSIENQIAFKIRNKKLQEKKYA
jgi:hypothetical protein